MKDLTSYAKAFLDGCGEAEMPLPAGDGALAQLYKTQPDAMRYEMQVGKMANLGDIARRFKEARSLYFDAQKGLNDAGEGFLLRENGLYLMALIDCIELCSEQLYEHYRALIDIFRESMRGLLRWQEKETGLFASVIDQPSGESNPLDLCGSVMAAYALYKAVRLGVLDGEKVLPIADRALEGVTHRMPENGAMATELATVCRMACSEYLLTGRE